jgi:hypothetical protein
MDKQSDDNDDYFEAYMKTVLLDVIKDEYKSTRKVNVMVRPPTNPYQWWNA